MRGLKGGRPSLSPCALAAIPGTWQALDIGTVPRDGRGPAPRNGNVGTEQAGDVRRGGRVLAGRKPEQAHRVSAVSSDSAKVSGRAA